MKKKLTILFLTALCVCVAAYAAGCSGETPSYYTLTYEPCVGVTVESEVRTGAQVKKGYTVRFRIIVDEEKAAGTPSVRINDREISAKDGEYSFTMARDTTVRIEGIYRRGQNKIVFDEGDFRTKYVDMQGNALGEITAETGSTVRFRVEQSVYYVGTPVVLANTMELFAEPDEGGAYYSFEVTGNTTIKVTGLEIDTPYAMRADGGRGTADDPYNISRPIDLYYMADAVADERDTVSAFAYFRMTADIDMKGEQLYIIGDATVSKSAFCGTFDGEGHTISNFTVLDYIIEQQNFTQVSLPYVGVFGFVGASTAGSAQIRGLHLRDFTIEADRTRATSLCAIGPLVGYASGADIIGCTAQGGTMHIVGSPVHEVYAGGLVGILQSSYTRQDLRSPSMVRSCMSDVSVAIDGGLGMTAGGLVGYLRSIERRTPATVLNSFATGDVSGAVYGGGLVGMTTYSVAVENSYATGDVSAYSPVDFTTGTGDEAQDFRNIAAYAGGLIGYLEHSSVVYASFALGNASATVGKPSGVKNVGALTGAYGESGRYYIEDSTAYAEKCYTGDAVKAGDKAWFTALGWTDADWNFDGELPAIRFDATTLSYDITVRGADTAQGKYTVTDTYLSMCDWYLADEGLPRSLESGTSRSYGYFFDDDLARPVPDAFVPAGEITLYVGFAEIPEVAGIYYLPKPSGNSYVVGEDKTFVQLRSDGTLYYRNGGMSGESYYLYDGTYVWLYDVLLAEHFPHASTYVVGTFRGEITGGVLRIHDLYSLLNTPSSPLSAYAEDDGFAVGTYYRTDDSGISYVFYHDGTGATVGNTTTPFTYTRNGNTLNIRTAVGASVTADIESGVLVRFGTNAVSHRDRFFGTWEAETTNFTEYEFDGIGGWKKYAYAYTGGEKVRTELGGGAYTLSGDTASLSDGTTAVLRDKLLYVNDALYTRTGSFRGDWVFSRAIGVHLTLYGLRADGVGEGRIDFGGSYGAYDVLYASTDDGIDVYYDNILLAQLAYDKTNYLLTGTLYSFGTGELEAGARFAAYDIYRGTWVSDDETFGEVRFDGLGTYDVAGSDGNIAIRGHMAIGADTVRYIVTPGTDTATFTYKETAYTISMHADGFPHITAADGTDIVLYRRDRMYGVTLVDEAGNLYAFDGKAAYGSGTVTYTPTDGAASTMPYTLTGEQIAIDGKPLVMGDGIYTLTDGTTTVTLTRDNMYTGDWLIGATEGDTLHIGKLGPTQNGFRASGRYAETATSFVYDEESGDLTFVCDGDTYTLTAFYHDESGATELRLTYPGGTEVTCLSAGADYIDDYRGLYTAKSEDTRIRRLYFDGFSGSHFGAGGTALVAEQSESGATLYGSIAYMYDEFGHLVFHRVGVAQYIFIEAQDGEYEREGSDKKYDLIEKDLLYGRTMYYKTVRNEIDYTQEFRFDGIGTAYHYNVVTDEETAVTDETLVATYTYEILAQDEEDKLGNRYRLVFTDAKGQKTDVILEYGGSVLVLVMDLPDVA